MEVRDGFITGISDYCDRWCAACAFTSRCRSFAAAAEAEGALDPNFKAIVDGPPLPQGRSAAGVGASCSRRSTRPRASRYRRADRAGPAGDAAGTRVDSSPRGGVLSARA